LEQQLLACIMAKKAPKSRRGKRTKQEIVEEEDESSDDHAEEEDTVGSDDSENDGSDSESESESDGEEDVAALFKGAGNDEEDEDSENDDDDDDEDMDDAEGSSPLSSEPYTFDLRNMLALNTDQLAMGSLYKKKKSGQGKEEIPLDPTRGSGLDVNEDYLLAKATDGCTQLIRALWELPMEASDAGRLATLPAYDEVRLPRAMPPPPPKQETKWEKFAKQKGIPLNKEKRSRKVWDEATGSWMYRHGYEKANKKENEWPIMEVGAKDDPYADPWEKQREEKRARVDRNIERRMKNEERAGNLAKGATNRTMKAREKAYKTGKEAGRKDSQSLPVGLPVDLNNSSDPNKSKDNKLRGKNSTLAALTAVQRSTASLGKFDKMREGEPERKKAMAATQKKRKFAGATDKKVLMSEGDSSMKILNAVMNGGGAAKAKAIRKGQLAKGETAYDYEFNDGLGASSFKKKKGRAGIGKMKKMTKKRAK
jgi:regulator of ribosome biosynthesis